MNLVEIYTMKKDGIDRTIEKAKTRNFSALDLTYCVFDSIPETIGDLVGLQKLNIGSHELAKLPESIGSLVNLKAINVNRNNLRRLPKSIGNLINLVRLDLSNNRLLSLPVSFKNLTKLGNLDISNNRLITLPTNFCKLVNLIELNINGNPLDDLSILQRLPNLKMVRFLGVYLPRQYWTKFSDWKPEWLLVEENAEIKRTLVEHVGYEKICDELGAIEIDAWHEYTLLKIDKLERIRRYYPYPDCWVDNLGPPVSVEPMVFLRMTCPSTRHIHILRVPPETTSAEAEITWVNHGIHPGKIAVAT